MSRKHLTRLLAVLMMLSMTLPPSFAFADAPTDKAGKPELALQEVEVPTVVAETVAVRESLTADQVKATQEILDRYLPALNEVSAALPKLDAPAAKLTSKDAGDNDAAQAQAKATLAALKQATARLNAIQAEINKEMAGVLSAEQYAKFEAAFNPVRAMSEADAKASKEDGPTATDYNSTNAYYAALYAAYGRYYAYYGYLWGYYNYYYYSTTYGYYGYLYSYYSVTYSDDAVINAATGYWELVTIGSDFDGHLYASIANNNYAQYWSYYGYIYSLADYNNTGRTYAYNAYYYAYYGYYYHYYAYLNAYYAYYT